MDIRTLSFWARVLCLVSVVMSGLVSWSFMNGGGNLHQIILSFLGTLLLLLGISGALIGTIEAVKR